MKTLKIPLLSIVSVALVVMASSFSAKRFAFQSYRYNKFFTMGDASNPLNNSANWDAVHSLSGCSNSVRLCGIEVANVVPYATLPTLQEIIDQIRTAYIASGNTFTHGQVVDIYDQFAQKVAIAAVRKKLL